MWSRASEVQYVYVAPHLTSPPPRRAPIHTIKAAGVLALHESAVMDGTPVFNLVRETLPLAAVTGFAGVLNSTSNFVLDAIMRA